MLTHFEIDQAHRGKVPKFMAQPPLLLKGDLDIDSRHSTHTPIERAIIEALGTTL